MPLSIAKPGLKSAIESAFNAQLNESTGAESNKDVSPEDLISKLAEALTNAIHDYVTQATVNVNPGIAVSTAGSPAAQTGATTSPGTGNLS